MFVMNSTAEEVSQPLGTISNMVAGPPDHFASARGRTANPASVGVRSVKFYVYIAARRRLDRLLAELGEEARCGLQAQS